MLQTFNPHSRSLHGSQRMTCQASTSHLCHENVDGDPPSYNVTCWHLWSCAKHVLGTLCRHLLQSFATLSTKPLSPHATSCPMHDSRLWLQLGDGRKVFCKVERSHPKPSTAWWRPTSHQVRKEKKRKNYAFRRQFNEKPSMIPGCPGPIR